MRSGSSVRRTRRTDPEARLRLASLKMQAKSVDGVAGGVVPSAMSVSRTSRRDRSAEAASEGASSDGPSNSSRWIGVGSSDAREAAEAGRAATADALQGSDPRLLVVFCSDSYDLGALLEAINRTSEGAVPPIGCSTAGEISTDGPRDASVVVTAFGGDFAISTGLGLS